MGGIGKPKFGIAMKREKERERVFRLEERDWCTNWLRIRNGVGKSLR